MRFAITFLVAMAGCVATLRTDATLDADLACEAARGLVVLQASPQPGPAPKPKPGDKCSNCDGRGYVGDGNGIRVQCAPCRGTGKVVACASGVCK